MCNSANCSHLDDQIDDIFGTDPVEPSAPADVTLAEAQQYKMHKEDCPSCKGSGMFRSYMGRVVGNCFKCKGRGHMFYRQSVEQREKARSRAAEKRASVAASKADQASEWLAANPDEAKWLQESSARDFEFATSMVEALYKYGALTEKQEAAVRNATAKSLARQAQWAAERAEREANKADVDISRIAEEAILWRPRSSASSGSTTPTRPGRASCRRRRTRTCQNSPAARPAAWSGT